MGPSMSPVSLVALPATLRLCAVDQIPKFSYLGVYGTICRRNSNSYRNDMIAFIITMIPSLDPSNIIGIKTVSL